MAQLLINIDVPDIEQAITFYCAAFGLRLARRMGDDFVELLGGPAPLYLLLKSDGSPPFEGAKGSRTYQRHWSPVHLDWVVEDIHAAIRKAVEAGAKVEQESAQTPYGLLALLSDPFGHGFCLLQFQGRGYDAITTG